MATALPPHPGEFMRQKLEERGWTQEELAAITGRSRRTISGIASGRSGVTADMAIALGAAFGDDPAVWLRWNAEHELAKAAASGETVERRARLYQLAPIRDMQKRGWIRESGSLDDLEADLQAFFGDALTDGTPFSVAPRRTVSLAGLNPAERAWCFRAKQLASVLPAAPFSRDRLGSVARKLRQLAAFPKEAGKLSDVLIAGGIRFVVVEPLPGAKIDGAAFWLSESKPVIAVSIRYDRIDAFWFTVMHEFAHIQQDDELSTDVNLLREGEGGISVVLSEDENEQRANAVAANALVPQDELDSFVRRLRPYYSSDRIVQFANKVKMHPGIIVGQLQHRGELGYSALRDFLVKIRSTVIQTALTDGWGQTISPGIV